MKLKTRHRQTRRQPLLIILLLLAITSLLIPTSAECFDCGGEAQHACTEQALQDLNDCYNRYGDLLGDIFCKNTFNDSYYGCMVLKGCPNPAKPSF